ncbi:MAG: hypothetical protein ABSF14_21110 [Terriglobia bacterium]|jgi:hypothetical protein
MTERKEHKHGVRLLERLDKAIRDCYENGFSLETVKGECEMALDEIASEEAALLEKLSQGDDLEKKVAEASVKHGVPPACLLREVQTAQANA